MSNPVTRILLAEHNVGDARLLEQSVLEAGRGHFDVARAASLDDAVSALASRPFDVVLLDLSAPDCVGPSAIRRVAAAAPAVPIVVITGAGEDNGALEMLVSAADDYLVKDCATGPDVIRAVRYAIGRRKVEEALRLSESRLRRLYESGVIGIAYSRADGVVTEANDAFLEVAGVSHEDLAAGRVRWRDMTAPRHLPAGGADAEGAEGAGVAPYEEKFIRKDGSRVAVLVGHAGLGGADEGFISFVLDQTERKHFEQALKDLNQTLEDRVRERTAVAEERAAQLRIMSLELTQAEQRERRRLAGLLHDNLQQLLAAARMYAGMARSQTDGDCREAVSEAERLITEAIAQSRSLTLELSPPILYEAGLVAALEWLARWSREKYGLDVAVSADPRVDEVAEPVKVLLFQAVRELLFNIVKHAGVRAAEINASPARAGHVRIEVIDAGVGFEDSRDKPAAAMTGFGLFSIRQRIGLLGGTFAVESAPGRGARVSIVCPTGLSPGQDRETPPAERHPRARRRARAPADGRPLRVLLVDDHEIMRRGLVSLLRRAEGVEVVGEAADGCDAVAKARALRPDVVIMDVSLPRMSGIEATRRIIADSPDVRVIGLSLHEEADMAAAMRMAGASAYLTKGGPADALMAAIRGVASGAE
jgi:PAS domain S-box-containing protein